MIIERKIKTYNFKLNLTQEEAIKLCEEIGEWNQDKWGFCWRIGNNLPKSINAKLFMVLSDTLQDLNLIPMCEGRDKGDKSYPRLDNDDVEVVEE
jgi:hypothetical protein